MQENKLIQENSNKLNRLKLMVSQKFLNIFVSILSSKLKEYFINIINNSKYIKIKKLGYDLGEKNPVYKF